MTAEQQAAMAKIEKQLETVFEPAATRHDRPKLVEPAADRVPQPNLPAQLAGMQAGIEAEISRIEHHLDIAPPVYRELEEQHVG